jgi:hypothetical protein
MACSCSAALKEDVLRDVWARCWVQAGDGMRIQVLEDGRAGYRDAARRPCGRCGRRGFAGLQAMERVLGLARGCLQRARRMHRRRCAGGETFSPQGERGRSAAQCMLFFFLWITGFAFSTVKQFPARGKDGSSSLLASSL